jgi:hypothetical protein
MKSISESIIGRRGSSNYLTRILRQINKSDILIIIPETEDGVDEIRSSIQHNKNIENIILDGDIDGAENIFVGTFQNLQSIHTRVMLYCDIFLFKDKDISDIQDATKWLQEQVYTRSYFGHHPDRFFRLFSGKIQF